MIVITEEKLRKIIAKNLLKEASISGGGFSRFLRGEKSNYSEVQFDSKKYNIDKDKFTTEKTKEMSGNVQDPEGKLNSLDSFAKTKLNNLFNDLKSKGYGVYITSGYRTIGKQASMIAQGKGMATATSGYSPHNFGLAVDLNIIKPDGSWVNSSAPKSDWQIIDDLCRKHKLQWGGHFSQYDPVHVDVYPQLGLGTNRNTIANKLRKAADAFMKEKGGSNPKYSQFKSYIGKSTSGKKGYTIDYTGDYKIGDDIFYKLIYKKLPHGKKIGYFIKSGTNGKDIYKRSKPGKAKIGDTIVKSTDVKIHPKLVEKAKAAFNKKKKN